MLKEHFYVYQVTGLSLLLLQHETKEAVDGTLIKLMESAQTNKDTAEEKRVSALKSLLNDYVNKNKGVNPTQGEHPVSITRLCFKNAEIKTKYK